MSVLAPLYILGALAVGVPIVLHMIRRTPRGTQSFSSLMFLSPSPPRVTRRSRIEHWLLLLLRAAAVALLAFAFARPFLRQLGSQLTQQGPQRHVAVLVDVSGSMRREGLWKQVQSETDKIIDACQSNDQVALYAFDDALRVEVAFPDGGEVDAAAQRNLVKKQVDAIRPGWRSSKLGGPLMELVESLIQLGDEGGPREIYLLSDLQSGIELEGFKSFDWPKDIKLNVVPIQDVSTSNASIRWLENPDDEDSSELYVRVSNQPKAEIEKFRLQYLWDDGSSTDSQLPVQLAEGTTRVIRIPRPSVSKRLTGIRLVGDDHEFDNICYLVENIPAPLGVLYVGAKDAVDSRLPRYFFDNAVDGVAGHEVNVTACGGDEVAAALSNQPDTRLVVVTEPCNEDSVDALQEALAAGKAVWFVLQSPSMAESLASVLTESELVCREPQQRDYRMWGEIDFSHPLFASFADPQYSDFTKIRFWNYRQLEWPGSRDSHVIAAFDDGAPAVVEFPVDDGFVVVWTSGWHVRDSQLARSSKFVPLVHELVRHYARVERDQLQYEIGDRVALPAHDEPLRVIKPNLEEEAIAIEESRFVGTDQPGLYQIEPGDQQSAFAVNLTSREGRTAPLDLSQLEVMGLPVRGAQELETSQQRERHLKDVELESNQQLWRWTLLAVIIILGLETLIASRQSRVAATQE